MINKLLLFILTFLSITIIGKTSFYTSSQVSPSVKQILYKNNKLDSVRKENSIKLQKFVTEMSKYELIKTK